MKTYPVLIPILLFPILTFAQARPDQPVALTPAHLESLASIMRSNHPALRAFEARSRAAHHAIEGVRTWEDPTFTFGGVVGSDRGPDLGEEGNLVYGLEQKLPLFGRPAATRTQARAEAEVALARQELQFQMLRRDLARALFQAAYEERLLELGREDLAWLETMAGTAEDRYRAGAGSQVEVLRLQNERARRADQLRTDEALRDHTRVTIHRLLGREPATPLPRFTLPEPASPLPYHPDLADRAARLDPRQRVLDRETAAATAQVAVTRKMRLPEISAGIEGRQYTGDGGFREGLFAVSFSLPWLNGGKYRSDLSRDRARVEAVQSDAADLAQGVREEVHRLTVVIDAARRQALLYHDEIIPRADQALESARAGWLNQRGMFLDVLEARRQVVEARLAQARAVAEQHQNLHELQLLGAFDPAPVTVLPPSPTPP